MTSARDEIEDRWPDVPLQAGLERAHAYASGMHRRPYSFYRRRIEDMGASGELALDAGCGTGTWSFALAPDFDHVEAIDTSAERVQLARLIQNRLGIGNITFVQGDVLEASYPDDHFDLIFCYSVLISYLPLRDVLGEFRRMLKPDGLLYVSLNGDGWSLYLKEVRGSDSERHRRMGTEALYRSLTERALPGSMGSLSRALRGAFEALPTILARLGIGVNEGARLSEILRSSPTVEEIASKLEAEGLPGTPPPGDARGFATDVVLEVFASALEQVSENETSAKLVGAVRADCGPEYLEVLANDILSLYHDPEARFSFPRAGRGYEPEEVERVCDEAGLADFRWAEESKLFSKDLVSYEGTYSRRLKVWDFVARKA